MIHDNDITKEANRLYNPSYTSNWEEKQEAFIAAINWYREQDEVRDLHNKIEELNDEIYDRESDIDDLKDEIKVLTETIGEVVIERDSLKSQAGE